MIHSMTAFARKQQQTEMGTFIWEIRTVNHRYLELSPRLPEKLRELEPSVRETLKKRLHRGKVECSLFYQPSTAASGNIQINRGLVKQLIQASDTILAEAHAQIHPPGTMELLRWPGVTTLEETYSDTLKSSVNALLEATLDDLISMRQREGDALATGIQARLAQIQAGIVPLIQRQETLLETLREKLVARIEALKPNCDPDRLEQEIVILVQKADIAEELERLQAHLKETQAVISQGGICGRRLDFLMQELNREANTIGSKANDAQTTRQVVELKVLIEQMREQIQNIE